MSNKEPKTRTGPGKHVEMKADAPKAVGHPAEGTGVEDFERVKRLLSSKPNRRPNRTKPRS